jgi:hypothetical protein
VRQRDHEHQRAREVGVVRGVRIEVEKRQWSTTHLIGDASWLLVPPVVHAVTLHAAQPCQTRVERFTTIQIRGLPTRCERVAAKQGRVQRHPGLQRQPLVLLSFSQRKGCEVPDICAENPFGVAVRWHRDARQAVSPFSKVPLATFGVSERCLAVRVGRLRLEA